MSPKKIITAKQKLFALSLLFTILTIPLTPSLLLAQAPPTETESPKTIPPQNPLPTPNSGYGIEVYYPNIAKENTFYYEAKPGETITDKAIIAHFDPQPEIYKLYTVDKTQTSTGEFAFESEKSEKNEIGLWGSVDPETILLESNKPELVTLNLKVPETAELNQTYSGGIIIQKSTPEETTNPAFKVISRTAKRIDIFTTDKPFIIPHKAQAFHHSFWTSGYIDVYFWVSLFFFITSLVLMATSQMKPKKKSKK